MEEEAIKTLANAESDTNGTSLITIYIAANTNLWLVKDHVNAELKTASNIKNKNVGKSVTTALKSVLHQLSVTKELPSNGMVLCAGEYSLPKNIISQQYI